MNAWTWEFSDICACIALEFGDMSRRPTLEYRARRTVVIEALRKFYRPECFWEFDSVAPIMADCVMNEISKQVDKRVRE